LLFFFIDFKVSSGIIFYCMELMKISGLKVKVRRKIFVSEESGFGVFKVLSLPGRESEVIVGNLFDVREGDTIQIDGEYIYHQRFGSQIKVFAYEIVRPQDLDGIKKFLSSERVKGVGKKSAEKIVDKFGIETFEIIEKFPERLNEIKGLRKNIIEGLTDSLRENKVLRELIVKLSPFGIGNETAFKIFKEFGKDTFEILGVNPYSMIDRIRGIGFKRADMVARGFGISHDDPFRIMAGLKFVLSGNEERKGDLYMTREELVEAGKVLLGSDSGIIEEGISNLLERNEVASEKIPEDVIILFNNFLIEKAIARYLLKIRDNDEILEEKRIDTNNILNKLNVELTDEQKNAVESAVNNSLTIITGGPGTGKTTIIRAIIEAFESEKYLVQIAAPTGRAAKRIEEATSCRTSTIHRMLRISPDTRQFIHDESNPLKADAVIIDEFSMVDTNIFFSLLKAIPRASKLIIIGDKDQLPSVGPGNVLRDLISSGYFRTIYLNRNFRQSENSLIIDNAYRINNGSEPQFKAYSEDLDFVFINFKNSSIIPGKVKKIIEYYKDSFDFNSMSYQVLSPVYRGDAGIDNLNRIIQESFNPADVIYKSDKIKLKEGDKVMQLKNNYDKDIFNGEHGVAKKFDKKTGILTIDYDGVMTEYSTDELDEITLSYVISIHKSQGSEYDFLILILSPAHSMMLNRELLYTAVTRAKKKIILISDMDTISNAVQRSTPGRRKTLLKMRLDENFKKQ